jgi:hypothetical protein
MALVNPNIALAGTPMQVPNFLGMQQTAAATQNTLASTGIMQEEAARASETATYNTALTRSKDALRFVNTPEAYLAWTESSLNDPVLGPVLQNMGVDRQKALASAMEMLRQPGGLQTAIGKSASSIDQLAQSMTQQGSQARTQAQAQAEAAAANARAAQQDAQVQAILTGQGGASTPVATAAPIPPPVNTLATPAQGIGLNALSAPPMSAAEQMRQTYAPTAESAPQAPMAMSAQPAPTAPQAADAATLQTANQIEDLASKVNQLFTLGTPAAMAAAKRLQDQIKFLREQEPSVDKLPTSVQEYRFAVDQGFRGSFEEWKNSKPPLFESEYEKLVGESAAKRDTSAFESAATAVDNLPKMYDTLNQIEASDAITGIGADVLKNVERLRAQFMADKTAGKRVADTEILNALLGSEVFPLIGALGIGARGLDTPAEREFLREVMTGTIQMDKAALSRLTKVRINIAERAIDKYNERVDKGELDRFFRTQGLEPQKIEKPKFESRAATARLTDEQRQALDWANSNPNDPRSALIKQRLGM